MNEHSEKYDLVKGYYENHIWGKPAVKIAVVRGWITAAEFTEITGEPYEP